MMQPLTSSSGTALEEIIEGDHEETSQHSSFDGNSQDSDVFMSEADSKDTLPPQIVDAGHDESYFNEGQNEMEGRGNLGENRAAIGKDINPSFLGPMNHDDSESMGDFTQDIDMGYEDMHSFQSPVNRTDSKRTAAPRLSSYFQGTSSSSSGGSFAERRNSKRQSFASARRISTESQQTSQSAPSRIAESDMAQVTNENMNTQRRVTVHGRADGDNNNESISSISRSNRSRISGRFGGGTGGSDRFHSSSSKTNFVNTIVNRRRSTRQNRGVSTLNYSTAGSSDTTGNTLHAAVERLNSYQSTDFEYVSAAAAVVAATSQPSSKHTFIQFSQGDHVLVILAILGLADIGGDKDLYTIDPVNCHGYPRGEGKTDAQNQEPFLYVLCVVTQVHFDEDVRYYTIRRCDTGTEQRADPGYMEPIREITAIEVAYNASQRTRKQMAEQHRATPPKSGFCIRSMKSMIRFGINLTHRFIPTYTRSRNVVKHHIQRMIRGEPGCSLHLRFSGINFLVCCSIFFLFHDVFALGFLPSKGSDFVCGAMGLIVWTILVVELFLEYLIRPKNYQELVRSDKAFTPSTARLLNRFHFVCESLSLIIYLPQSICGLSGVCNIKIGATQRTLWALISANEGKALLGRFLLGLTFLRSFGLARHWKQMWLNHTYEKNDQENSLVRRLLFVEKVETGHGFFGRKKSNEYKKNLTEDSEYSQSWKSESATNGEDQQLKNAANIGTALMLVNSHRALFILLFIIFLFPAIFSDIIRNPVTYNQVELLLGNNIASNTTDDCTYLNVAVTSWLESSVMAQTRIKNLERTNGEMFLLWAQVLPVRCPWQQEYGVITSCAANQSNFSKEYCTFWNSAKNNDPDVEYFANLLNVRTGAIVEVASQSVASSDFYGDSGEQSVFYVRAFYNQSNIIAVANASLFLLLASMVLFGLLGLTIMRSDSERLVLSPLQRMLSIVVRYAENPLSTPSAREPGRRKGSINSHTEDDTEEQLGHYETEQLINAIAKIADLLRKCWGVAGAGIISSNLARTKDGSTVVFNPTIPGKQVYALFGFIGLNDFSRQLRSLEQDVMILINDVARVVHDEVYRWALGDSGQCNKNLGAAFLMVFRIGDFSEVHDKKKRATDVVFDSQLKIEKTRLRQASTGTMRRRASNKPFDLGSNETLQLASLPGIQAFADRALLGCLKSFAGLHRDQNMQEWQKDFRLGAGVGNYHISVIYGMDAGWAVEGAVGSEYKIDATYLSPHVNMASRMMSACKQYGVKFLLSQAVEELMSKTARTKLRHLDTVFVKGSNVAQRIYTYDARHEGVDFFLFERTPDQADIEAEAYNPSIWDNDQDLKSMRQHVTDEFMEKFKLGVDQYLEGHWKLACKNLEAADNMMFEAVLEQGFVDYITEDLGEYGKNLKISKEELNRLKNDFGDGACKCLLQYMQRRNCQPPADWDGVRHLMSK